MKVTLIPEAWARSGEVFHFMGKTPECEDCKLNQPCLALEKGLYEIVKVRKVNHTCQGPFEGRVKVAEVETTAMAATLSPGPGTLQGATVTIRGDSIQRECTFVECSDFNLCHPPNVTADLRVNINSLEGPLECPLGHKLIRARVEPASSK